MSSWPPLNVVRHGTAPHTVSLALQRMLIGPTIPHERTDVDAVRCRRSADEAVAIRLVITDAAENILVKARLPRRIVPLRLLRRILDFGRSIVGKRCNVEFGRVLPAHR
jgi:hypothetical protein